MLGNVVLFQILLPKKNFPCIYEIFVMIRFMKGDYIFKNQTTLPWEANFHTWVCLAYCSFSLRSSWLFVSFSFWVLLFYIFKLKPILKYIDQPQLCFKKKSPLWSISTTGELLWSDSLDPGVVVYLCLSMSVCQGQGPPSFNIRITFTLRKSLN